LQKSHANHIWHNARGWDMETIKYNNTYSDQVLCHVQQLPCTSRGKISAIVMATEVHFLINWSKKRLPYSITSVIFSSSIPKVWDLVTQCQGQATTSTLCLLPLFYCNLRLQVFLCILSFRCISLLYFVSNLINSTCINFKRSIRCILCQYWLHLQQCWKSWIN
jgi:hypothetical protein